MRSISARANPTAGTLSYHVHPLYPRANLSIPAKPTVSGATSTQAVAPSQRRNVRVEPGF